MSKTELDDKISKNIMLTIQGIEPEKKEIVTVKRVLILIGIAVFVFLSAGLFTLFLVDFLDKMEVLEFLEKNQNEVFKMLAIELVVIAILFSVFAYFLYRKTILPLVKSRLKLFVLIFTTVFLISSIGLAIVQTNTFELRDGAKAIKDNITSILPIQRDLDNQEDFFEGKLIYIDKNSIKVQNKTVIEEFLWQNNFKNIKQEKNVIIKYENNETNQKIIEKIQETQ